MRQPSLAVLSIVCGLTLAAGACKDQPRPPVTADSAPAPVSTEPIAVVDSLATPESAIHDTGQDVYFVSNINGGATDRDNNGFISRIRPDGSVENLRFIAGGQSGVTLNGPKGLALRGDSLWVSDLTVVRIFNARTGASLGTVNLTPYGAVFLNDVAMGPDGAVYITDSGIKVENGEFTHPGPDRIYRIAPDRQVTTLMTGEHLGQPNGITWDQTSNRLLVGPLGDSTIYTFAVGDSAPTAVIKGPGGYDGIELLDGGRFVVSSHNSASILVYSNGALRSVIDSLQDPGDIGIDRKRGRLLIPSLGGNRLEIRPLPQ